MFSGKKRSRKHNEKKRIVRFQTVWVLFFLYVKVKVPLILKII